MSASGIPVIRIRNTLLSAIQGDLSDQVAEAFQQHLLTRIEATGASGVLLDISALEIVDTYVARVLVDTAKMARLMGARTVLVGMRPEVAATLINMGNGLDGLETALNVDDGLDHLGTLRSG
ncbi:anti-sigma factor antagonist [Deltaproteobacteria bacterium]|nr:anti-sigma factor antagonist [Deltaproteobacteria bacterium]